MALVQGAPVVTPEEKKEAKKVSAKKHAEKVKAQKIEDHKKALAERDELQKLGVFDKLSVDIKNAILARCIPPDQRATPNSTVAFFDKVFGAGAPVGTSKTLTEVMKSTGEGTTTMKQQIKKWEKKGIIVAIDTTEAEAKKDPFLMKYIIKQLPTAKPVSHNGPPKTVSTVKRQSQKPREKITPTMKAQSYIHAKLVYNGNLSMSQAITQLHDNYGMNSASAQMYITGIKCLLKGEGYGRDMSQGAIEYYLEQIQHDDGKEGLRKALNALRLRIEYLENNNFPSHAANVRRIYEAWERR